ncbi:MAG: hypothetical protein F6K65_26240 [Moorea sp. SIO3C2]|nr:hypothetical protein [Moorena sp. SIO3C2]
MRYKYLGFREKGEGSRQQAAGKREEGKKSCLPYTPHLPTIPTLTFFFTTMISTLLLLLFFPKPTPNQQAKIQDYD